MSYEAEEENEEGDRHEQYPVTRADSAELLDQFEREIWPLYQRRDFAFRDALLVHLTAQAVRRLDQLVEREWPSD